jgi:hypothetical protein
MATNTDYNTIVENYLSGEMSSSDKLSFENEMTNNPPLKAELSHQTELIKGIQQFRKVELKGRLAAINVNPTIYGVISQSAALKSVIISTSALLIATGAYIYFNLPEANFELEHINPISEYKLGDNNAPEVINELDPVEINKKEIKPELIQKIENAVKIAKTEILKVHSPDFSVPNSPDASGSESLPTTTEEILRNRSNSLEDLADVDKTPKVEVQNIIDKKYKFHYQHLEGKLYLYGKFNEGPYEIIEINGRKGKNIFFFYQGRYHKIKRNTSEVTRFEMITDLALIKELEILKEK